MISQQCSSGWPHFLEYLGSRNSFSGFKNKERKRQQRYKQEKDNNIGGAGGRMIMIKTLYEILNSWQNCSFKTGNILYWARILLLKLFYRS